MANDDILVSINCMAYNHEKYIADALEGFVKQKTDFKFEVLVHDDASTDNTSNIIREYENKYPDIIKAVYQKENQYSKDKLVGRKNLQRARGKYIAICEGDDYWIDVNKLQRQVDYMESHLECNLCFHDAYMYNIRENTKTPIMAACERFKGEGLYSVEDIIQMPTLPAVSLLYRKECIENLPDFYKNTRIGDLALILCLSYKGYVYGFSDIMSVYRYNVPNSFITSTRTDREKYNEFADGVISVYKGFDEYTNYKYHNVLQKKIAEFEDKKKLKKEAIELVVQNENVYIYGTGAFAQLCFKDLADYQDKVCGFIVSDGRNKAEEFMGKNVYYLSEIEPGENVLLLGLDSQNIAEVIENVKARGWKKISYTYSY